MIQNIQGYKPCLYFKTRARRQSTLQRPTTATGKWRNARLPGKTQTMRIKKVSRQNLNTRIGSLENSTSLLKFEFLKAASARSSPTGSMRVHQFKRQRRLVSIYFYNHQKKNLS